MSQRSTSNDHAVAAARGFQMQEYRSHHAVAAARGFQMQEYRSSVRRAQKRRDAGKIIRTCAGCGCEVDVGHPHHDVRCQLAPPPAPTLKELAQAEPRKPRVKTANGRYQSANERMVAGSSKGEYTGGEMERRFAAIRDASTIAVSCAVCGELIFDGPFLEGRTAAAKHRKENHPELAGKRPRRTGFGLGPTSQRKPEPELEGLEDAPAAEDEAA